VSDFRARSFDPPRDRTAPRLLRGCSLEGEKRQLVIDRPTLVIAVKPLCDGCRQFVDGDLSVFHGIDVVIASATPSEEWRGASHSVWVSPELLEALGVTAPPFFVLIDPRTLRVLVEGAVFSPAQVASEIGPVLDR